MANANNLKPWKPGQSGNPRGRPKGRSLSDILADYMGREVFDANGQPLNQTVADRFIERVVNLAMADGNPALIREIFDRHDGKVPEPGKTIEPDATIRVVYEDDTPPEAAPEAAGGD